MNSKGKSLYDFIPKFQKYNGTFVEKDDKDGKKEIFIAEYWPQPEFIFPKIIS